MSKSLIAALLTVAASSAAHAAAYYVAPTGNNANAGTSASPWKTIQYAADTARAGDTINIRAGTYKESIDVSRSGSASGGYITIQSYPGEQALVDGSGLTVKGQRGLINIASQSYIKIVGLEIANYSASSTANIPVGIWITGAGGNIQILNNHIHDIKNNASGEAANALGLAVYGNNSTASINNLTIDGNEIDHLKLGSSESLVVDGNVEHWLITNNLVHDNNNIAIDAIGFEGVSSNEATDQARDGVISGNTVYNITSYGNTAYGNAYAADGIYCDGCTRVVIERNTIHHTDFGVEVASEWSGKTATDVTVRNNLIYSNNAAGLTIGGYDANRGGVARCNVVNNSFYNNDTKNTGAGEIQIQYHATRSIVENNIVYAGKPNLFVYDYSGTSRVDLDYNLYFSSGGAGNSSWTWNAADYSGFDNYRAHSQQDAHSAFANPLYVNLTTPDLQVAAGAPAVNAGTDLGSAIVGTLDRAGNARIKAGTKIDIGAYEQ